MLPAIGLYNPFFMGDSVLLEPIARRLAEIVPAVYVIGNSPEIYTGHPTIKALPAKADLTGYNLRVVDMTDALRSMKKTERGSKGADYFFLPNKLRRMYNAAGISFGNPDPPKLYLTEEERGRVESLKDLYGGKRVGVVLEARDTSRTWPYISKLLSYLSIRPVHIFVFCKERKHPDLDHHGVIKVIGQSTRELMVYLAAMHCVVGPDTGPMHLAGALGIPIVVAGMRIWKDLYEPYENCEFISTGKEVGNLRVIPVGRVTKVLRKQLDGKADRRLKKTPAKKRSSQIAIMLLEGLGGTVTLSDHAKKIHERFGQKPRLIIRTYEELFSKNPHIESVECIGMALYPDAVEQALARYENIAVIKTGIGKWYGIKQELGMWEEIYNGLPLGTPLLEAYKMNLIQTANMSLGLPYSTVDCQVYDFEDVDYPLPDEFVVISNGVDVWHRGLIQTKCWPHEHWERFVELCSLPVIQAGTEFDRYVEGAIDFRTKTSVLQLLSLLRDAVAVVCQEGGLMHLSYAVGQQRTIVLRGPTAGYFYSYPGQCFIDSYVCRGCSWTTPDWYRECPKGLGTVCMKSITPERVVNAFRSQIAKDMVALHMASPVQLDYGAAGVGEAAQAVM